MDDINKIISKMIVINNNMVFTNDKKYVILQIGDMMKELDLDLLYNKTYTDAENRILKQLEVIFNKYVEKVNEWEIDILYSMFEDMVKMYKFNGFPKILKDDDYNNLKKNELSRFYLSMSYNKDLLIEENYHLGKGNICNGIFTTEDKIYTSNIINFWNNDEINTKVLKFKILSNNGANYTYLETAIKDTLKWQTEFAPSSKDKLKIGLLKHFVSAITDPELRESFMMVFKDLNNLAVFLGYDYIAKRNTNSGDLKIILNRGIIAVSESEYDRILSLTDNINID